MADSKMDWIREIPEDDLQKLMERDNKLVFEHCNMQTLLDLMENLHSIQIYISKRPLERAKQLYIARHFTGDNHKRLAAKLGCSLKYVYQTLKEINSDDVPSFLEPDLFNVES